MPQGKNPDVEERVNLSPPVPVFVSYFTAEAVGDEVVFRPDRYQRDPPALARYFGEELNLGAVSKP